MWMFMQAIVSMHCHYTGWSWFTDESAENGDSCSVGFTECHSQAQCVDYNPGFCCKCVTGFLGNGKVCLQDSKRLKHKIERESIILFSLTDALFLYAFFFQRSRNESPVKSRAFSTDSRSMTRTFSLTFFPVTAVRTRQSPESHRVLAPTFKR